ncbi:MAG TPA: hypothetical protein VFS44_01930 [Gemmatimonadaceae bacterium]|nr:hypothetical protein [Gemmatimonadaceae bacterium]
MARTSTVLICAEEPLIAALLGMLAEMAHYDPIFPAPDERPEDALLRVRPLLVVLLEGSLDAARSDLFFAQAAKRRVGVALFGRRGSAPTLAPLAEARGIPWLEVPTDAAQFRRVLETAATSGWWRRGGDRRRAPAGRREEPATERAPDGTLVYLDPEGCRWLVYDRRGGERRQGERRGTPEPGEHESAAAEPDVRMFVSERGEVWRCALATGELEDRTVGALARQLARAVRD